MEKWELREHSDRPSEGENRYFRSRYKFPLRTRLQFWGMLAGGVAVGTFLFLFFLTVFVYIFLPVAALFLVYGTVRRLLKR